MANTTPPRGPSTVGVEHECKWELDQREYHQVDDLEGYFDGSVLSAGLTPLRRPLTFVSSTLYLDDARRSLTRAGHTLGVVVNVGSASGICWLTLKQQVRRHAWRDGLELAERLTPAEVPSAMNDDSRLPVGHVRRCGLAEGPLGPVAVATQRRIKHLGRSVDGVEVAYSLDLVTFRSPDGDCPPIGEYACVEVEVNSSAPHALRLLGELADGLDQWLDRPRADRTKAQHALDAVDAMKGRARTVVAA